MVVADWVNLRLLFVRYLPVRVRTSMGVGELLES